MCIRDRVLYTEKKSWKLKFLPVWLKECNFLSMEKEMRANITVFPVIYLLSYCLLYTSDQAALLGANAVVGVDLDYETVGDSGSMLMVTASGTAVRIED